MAKEKCDALAGSDLEMGDLGCRSCGRARCWWIGCFGEQRVKSLRLHGAKGSEKGWSLKDVSQEPISEVRHVWEAGKMPAVPQEIPAAKGWQVPSR